VVYVHFLSYERRRQADIERIRASDVAPFHMLCGYAPRAVFEHREDARFARRLEREGQADGVNEEYCKVNCRCFLAAYMIATKVSHIFETLDERSEKLHQTSIRFVDAMDSIVTAFRASEMMMVNAVPKTLLIGFCGLLLTYMKDFKDWKGPDEGRYVSRMEHALVALYTALREGLETNTLCDHMVLQFRTQIQRLREKLGQQISLDRANAFCSRFETFDLSIRLDVVTERVSRDTDCMVDSPETDVR
jgi:hypothetical protein